MDLMDSTLMFLSESSGYPAVASIARTAYDQLAAGEEVDYRLLDDLIREASGKGLLRAMHARYSPTAYEAIITPVLKEIGYRKPVPPGREHPSWRGSPAHGSPDDPLTAPVWPPR
jgi:hypothetical protein